MIATMPSDSAHAGGAALVQRLAQRRVLVVGDMFLDQYLVGRATRLSREAPVPVLEQTASFAVPGGACNPAHNIAALGSQAPIAGVIGADAAGEELSALLAAAGVDTTAVVVDASRPTITKTRLVAESALRVPQHVARIDRLDRRPLDARIEGALLDRLEATAPGCDAILVSHYLAGVASDAVVDRVRQLGRQHGALTLADAQAELERFAGFDLIKCNRAEAETELGQALAGDADFERALVRLVPRLAVEHLVITRGGDGMSGLRRGASTVHSPAPHISQLFDVVGAGDTVIAVLALALAAGLALSTGLHLANAAAGLVVRRLGNAVVTIPELVAVIAGEGR
jgi:rfaE bifunctional protein kinase chain/domain